MARKRTSARTRKQPPEIEPDASTNAETIAVRQGNAEGCQVGYGNPPKEHQFKPGESGNPDGPPKHRTNLWVYFTQYMAMTPDERERIDRTTLTAAQETALKMVERAVKGKGCGFERLARYIVDREEGKAAEHLIFDNGADLSDEECDELRKLIQGKHIGDGHDTD